MTEMVPSGLMRGHWRRSDGAAYTGTKLETAETAKVHLHTTAPVLYSTCGVFPVPRGCSSCPESHGPETGTVWLDSGTDENQARRIWPLRGQVGEQAWTETPGNDLLSGLHPVLHS